MSSHGGTSSRMCAAIGLAIVAAALHGILGVVELLVVLLKEEIANEFDWVAALLVVKNVLCAGSEILCAIVACSAKNAVALDLLKNPGNGHPTYMLTQPAPMAGSQAVPVAIPIPPSTINHGAEFIGQR